MNSRLGKIGGNKIWPNGIQNALNWLRQNFNSCITENRNTNQRQTNSFGGIPIYFRFMPVFIQFSAIVKGNFFKKMIAKNEQNMD